MFLDTLFDPSPSEDTPITCDPSALSETEATEHAKRAEALFGEKDDMHRVPGGVAFRFPGTMEHAEQLLKIVRDERRCCPFLSFGILFEPEERGLWLYMGGDDRAEAYIAEEFDPERFASTA